ncbi:MAG: hypothetical protein OHK0046_13980 [Anaerolineae bacterium]
MGNLAIRVENLGKQYRIGAAPVRYRTFRDVIINATSAPFRRARSLLRGEAYGAAELNQEFWALKDVSFEVQHGDVVGIIGRNGAGKSTLLKILSRITEPTTGRVELYGRVGALLEVGTGFHPELTGRENIYLNASILGMSRAEINRKFDEIVDFAEVEKFIDTPVKHYSSGMGLRLGFAVAAHLEPEILVVDEVLAVGDAAFQKKCLGKMSDVASEGRTVLFVSHNMAAVQGLCKSSIVLNQGNLTYMGEQNAGIEHYLNTAQQSAINLTHRKDRHGSGQIKIKKIECRDLNGSPIETVLSGQTFDIYLHFAADPDFYSQRLVVSVSFKTRLGMPVFLHHNRLSGDTFGRLPKNGAFVVRIYELPLAASVYTLDYSVMQNVDYIDRLTSVIDLEVIEGDFFGSGEVPPPSHGVVFVKGQWRLESEQIIEEGQK